MWVYARALADGKDWVKGLREEEEEEEGVD